MLNVLDNCSGILDLSNRPHITLISDARFHRIEPSVSALFAQCWWFRVLFVDCHDHDPFSHCECTY